ncbi:hypothetical protein SBA5_40002 [Candidatus Sulfotelmatomonas gaucii]|uniref:Uncharacterized protein n=1 Tax=Candidatus Sulfuritelmatomonas gaucii TaxID=2043161 RepID=A0A2N9LJN2_9BACT|nr:hypothetical protein SBA5_40002 [Candidatus Sulfotelmatomonas gaucii]
MEQLVPQRALKSLPQQQYLIRAPEQKLLAPPAAYIRSGLLRRSCYCGRTIGI